MRARIAGALTVGLALVVVFPTSTLSQDVPLPPRDNSARPAVVGTALIRGRVVSVPDGQPLRGAQVRISMNGLTRVSTTDAEGRYEFASLPAGRHSLTASKPGFVQMQFGQTGAYQPGKPVTVVAAQISDGVDIALPRGSVITGRVTDQYGDPVAGAQVNASRYQYNPSGQRRLVQGNNGMFIPAFTDDRGEFRVFGLTPGTYVVSATSQMGGNGYIPPDIEALRASAADNINGYQITYFPGVVSPDHAGSIVVSLAQEVNASFSLVPARMARVSGVIRNSRGEPVAEGQLSLRSRSQTRTSGGRLNRDGSFLIGNVAPGEYFLDMQPARTIVMGGARPTLPLPSDAEFASVPLVVDGGDLSDLVVTTSPLGTIRGRVRYEGYSAKPTAAQRIRITVQPSDDSFRPFMTQPPSDSGLVDEDDGFTLHGVAGSVRFFAASNAWTMKSVFLDGVDLTDRSYEARPGLNVTGLEVVLTDQRQEVSGQVRNSTGEPVPNGQVIIVPSELPAGVLAYRFNALARLEQEGTYRVPSLPPGTYFAIAVEGFDQSAQFDPAFQAFVRSRGKQFMLAEGQKLTLDLQLLQ